MARSDLRSPGDAVAMTAEDVKTALRRRHHAAGGTGQMVGEWTCLEELWGIDLLAWSAWGGFKRVGYEVKVSRSDYRRELLNPHKRYSAVEACHSFYFAVPAGLLTADELAYREPGDLRLGDFQRVPCPGAAMGGPAVERRDGRLFASECGERAPRPRYGGLCHRYRRERTHMIIVPVPNVGDEHVYSSEAGTARISCPTCGGKGYVAKSRVEQEAPTLWVPADVGLVVVYDGGNTRVVRKAPTRAPREITGREMAHAIRWASVRPDPRHTHDRQVADLINDRAVA